MESKEIMKKIAALEKETKHLSEERISEFKDLRIIVTDIYDKALKTRSLNQKSILLNECVKKYDKLLDLQNNIYKSFMDKVLEIEKLRVELTKCIEDQRDCEEERILTKKKAKAII